MISSNIMLFLGSMNGLVFPEGGTCIPGDGMPPGTHQRPQVYPAAGRPSGQRISLNFLVFVQTNP